MIVGEVGQQKIYFKGERSKMDIDKGATLKEKMMDQISWTKEKHTSRGSKLMNLVCLHLICAYTCACLHCISV